MPGTILLDDLRSSIGDELRSHAQGLLQLGQGAVQSINDAIPTPPPVPQGPDPNQILQELQQHAQQAAAAAQPALQVLGTAGQAASGAVTQLGQARDQVAQQLQDHVASITQGAQNAVQTLGSPAPPTQAPVQQPTADLGAPPDRSMSLQDYARAAAQRAGIDPNVFTAQIQQESGFNPSARSNAGAIGVAQFMPETAKGVGLDPTDPYASLDAAAKEDAKRLQQYQGDWGKTLASYNAGAGAVETYGGIPPYAETQNYVKTIMGNAQQAAQAAGTTISNAVGGAASALGGAARGALDTASTAMNQSQFNDPQLTADEAYAACGPAAAVRFAERFGRNPTLREATDLAKQVGWTSGGGMAGITSEQRLLKNMGVDTHIVAPDWDAISREAQTGNPVTISTAGHYFFADGYNPQTGAFHVGRSGLDLKNGSEWMTPTQMENLMGRAQGALFADNPAVPASSTSPTALGGTGGASNAPITIGGPAPVKAPLYVKGAMQDADGNVVADQGPTPIQSAADVLGGAAGAVGEAVGGAASALGSAAQGALAQATAPVQLQPGQVSARDQVNQVASDVQQAAQGVLGAAQDANRQTPGTAAVNAVAPVLGAAASDLGTTARGVVDAAAPVLGGALQDENAQALAFAQSPIGHRLLQAAAENAQEGPSLIPAGTMSLYRDVMQVKNDWLEQNNPLNNLPGARPEPGHEGDITPGGLIAGLTTGIAQQFTDPLMLALLGPTSGVAEAGTGALSGAVSRIVGPQLAERLSPGAVNVLGTIAQKFSQGAIVGGLQNAMFEAEKKTSTPESVGQALVVGAGLGGVIDVGSVPVMAVVRRIGQVLLDRAPEISAALRSRQPAQANVNAALAGVPEMVARARGEGEPTAGFTAPEAEPSTRMYHGTGSGFDRPTGERFDPNGLYGPGYYLTSDPRVAGGVVAQGNEMRAPNLLRLLPNSPGAAAAAELREPGQVLSPGYAQERAPRPTVLGQQLDMYRSRLAPAQELLRNARTPEERTYFQNYVDKLQGLIDDTESKVTPPEAGPNVRAVDVPQNLNLLNVDAPVSVENARRISDAIPDAEDRRRFDIRVFPNDERTSTNGQTGDAVYQVLTRAYVSPDVSLSEAKTQAAQVLKQSGYDGITYNGGQRIPMNDAAGAPIEHQATVIFPESLDKVRNAVSGRQGGQAQVPFGINLAGGVAGGYAGNVATPQDASPEERLRNIGLGATAGLLGTHLITRGGVGPSLERAVAGVGREGFRAPETRPTLEEQLARAADRGPRPGENLLRATTEERSPSTDVTSQMQRNFLRDTVRAPNADPRPKVQDIGLPNEKLVHQNDLTDVVPAGTTVLYHETSVPNARALLDRIESGPRNQTPIFTSDNRDLALGQGGKGVMLEFDPARANGSVAPQKPGLTFTAATGSGQEYTVSRTLPGAVSAIVVRTERQAAQLATNARVARRFDFANAEPTADGGIRIPRRETGTALPAAAAVVTPRVAPEPTGFRAPETGATSEAPMTAASEAFAGARAAPGEAVTATTPTARVTASLGEPPVPPQPPERPPAPPAGPPPPPPTAPPTAPTGATPELDKLNAMYDGKKPKPATSIPDVIQQVGDSLTRMFTDRQVDINRAQERYAANLGRPLRGDEMAAELQRLASDPVAQVRVDEGLKPAIQSVGADYPALRNYVTLRSNIEVADNLATRTGKPEVGTDRLFSGGLNREESVKAMQDLEQQLGPERFARVQAAADQVTAFNQSMRERLVRAGVLDEGTAAQLEAQYPNWAKTRILDYMADPAGGQGAGTKLGLSDRQLREYTLKGTERAREDPIASTVAYAHQVERMAMKNEAFQAFLKIDQDSASPMLREVPQSYTAKSNETTMIGFVDGQKQKYVTDNKALGAAINGASVLSTPEWTSAWQKIFRSLATSRNPLFLAGNAALDVPTYVLRSSVREGGPLALPRILGELARGYGDAFQGLFQGEFRGEGTSAFLKGGGGQSGYFTGGEGQTKRAVAEMQRKNVFQINGWQDLGRLTKDLLTLHPVEALGERIELGPRVAAMRLAERRGANATQAVIDGRTVTVDFSQGGTVTKYLNNFIPFFNVGFQGPAQIARAFRDNPRAFVATVGTLIGIPSMAAEVWNKSDPQRAKDYADVPQYVKDQGIVVMLPGEAPVDAQGNRKPMYAVIKLREWMPFASLAREATGRVMGDDSRSWQEMASSIGSGLSPIQAQSAAQVGTEPLGGIPILPAAAQLEMNTDFFRGRTIVTQRADQNASAVSKAITPAIQAIVDRAGINAEVRPSAIDFLVRNQGAGVGGAALSASDLAAGQPSDTAGPTGLPGVGGLIGRFAGNQTGNELQQARDQTLTTEGRQTLRNNGITLTPGAVSGSVNQIPLNIEEETRYQQLTNRYIDAAIARTAASPDFARMTQVGKQSLMDQAMQAARSRAGIEVLNTIPADEKRRRLSTKSTAPAAA
jgi:soluble lytic murein transglycosylase-like protein